MDGSKEQKEKDKELVQRADVLVVPAVFLGRGSLVDPLINIEKDNDPDLPKLHRR